ncbi:MAG: tol-pal system protein YbgF [Deltaproteobacteria bacterium]|nr:tol-pal system protein YbgF [Deltaproteobacteria bacterium]
MEYFRTILLCLLLVVFSSCAAVNQLDRIDTDVSILKTEVSVLKRDLTALQESNQALLKKLADLDSRIDDEVITGLQELRGQLEEKQYALQTDLRRTEERIARLEERAPAPSPVSPTPPDLAPVPTPDAASGGIHDSEEVYADAFRIYKDGDFQKARDAFAAFLKQFPDTEYSDNAQFWVGECFYKERKYEQAILAYEDVIQKYPKGNKVPDAFLKQGLCFKTLGDTISSRILLQKVIDTYPTSPQADIARKELTNLQ